MSIIELVTSLKPAEKAHFTLYTGTRKGNHPKYVQLFNLIRSNLKITNEEIIKAGFSASDKHFLRDRIERSQHDLYLGNSVSSELKWLTESMERYFKEKQWKELKKCITKSKKKAEENDQYLDWLQAIYWEKEMLLTQPESRNLYEKLEILIEEEQQVKVNLLEEMNYFNLRAEIYTIIIKDNRLNNPENKEKFEQLISTNLLFNNEPTSIKSKIDYYLIKARIAKYNGDKEGAYCMANKLFNVFINNPKYKNEYVDRYKKSLCFICNICNFSGRIEEIPVLLELIGDDNQYFKAVCLYGILYSIIKLDKNRGTNYLDKIKNMINNGDCEIRPGGQLEIFYNGAVFWSLFSDWKEMDYWIQKILYSKRNDDRRDIQYCARILTLINQFELKADDMDNQIQKVVKYFARHDKYTKTIKHIIQAFRDLYKAVNRKDMIPIWTDLKDYLNTKVEDTNVATQQLGLGELSLWCTSKIENITMGEAFKKS